MRIAVIGSGNVATVLSRLFIQKGHQIVHVASRNPAHAKVLADEIGSPYSDYEAVRSVSADIFLIAIADAGFNDCHSTFRFSSGIVVHTAGSVSLNVLNQVSDQYGVLYPLQSLRKEMMNIPEIPFLVDGNNEWVSGKIHEFAGTLSPFVQFAGDNERLRLHAAAVIVSNFTNHMYALAEDFCRKEQVDFSLLKPLILETAQRIMTMSPSSVQTGPAARKDIQTLDKHLRLLGAHPKLRTTYLRLTDSIMNP